MAARLNISHSEYRIMCMLIGLWNKKQGMAFPTLDYLAKASRMGKQTVSKALKNLVNSGLLIVVKSRNKRNNYYFNRQLFDTVNGIHEKPVDRISCETDNKIKQNKIKNRTKHKNKINNDYDLKTIQIKEYRNIRNYLTEEGFKDAQKIILTYGIDRIKSGINIVETIKPENKGAYLRTILLKNQDFYTVKTNTNDTQKEKQPLNELFKHTFWEHMQTGKTYRALPEKGNHLLFKYDNKNEKVHLFEGDIIDNINNFKPSTYEKYTKDNSYNYCKPEKIDILKQMILDNKMNEAENLAILFNLKAEYMELSSKQKL